MEPVMKILDTHGRTYYLFHTERVIEIRDVGTPDKPAAEMLFASISFEEAEKFKIDGVTARDLKRTIQENAPDKIGFLKLDYNTAVHGKNARRYLNVERIVSMRAVRVSKLVDGQRVTLGGAQIYGRFVNLQVEGAVFAIAAQVRRIIKRLDQDEEFCCDAPAAEEASEE